VKVILRPLNGPPEIRTHVSRLYCLNGGALLVNKNGEEEYIDPDVAITCEDDAHEAPPPRVVTSGRYFYARVGDWACSHAHETEDAAEACAKLAIMRGDHRAV
jgi:hypothetical protein